MDETTTVTYRAMKRDDYPAIVSMMADAWYANDNLDPQISARIAEADFEYCLARSTEAQVAVADGNVVGVILGRIDANETRPLVNRHHAHVASALLPLCRSAAGRRAVRELRSREKADSKLLKEARETGNAYDAEIVLFLVDPAWRGKGIGGHLFSWLLDRFKLAGVKNYFLMTDTTCDFAFYDHQGLSLENTTPWPQSPDENMVLDNHLRVLMYDNETDASNEGVNPLGRD